MAETTASPDRAMLQGAGGFRDIGGLTSIPQFDGEMPLTMRHAFGEMMQRMATRATPIADLRAMLLVDDPCPRDRLQPFSSERPS